MLIDQLVIQILLYDSAIWVFHNVEQIEWFRRTLLKSLLKVNTNTGNGMVYGEVDMQSVKTIIEKKIILDTPYSLQVKQAI